MNNIWEEAIQNIVARVPGQEWQEGDYIGEDGLLYCGKCHTRKQCKVVIMDSTRIMPVMCDCERAKSDAEERALEEQKHREKVERLRRDCFQPESLLAKAREWRFEADERRDPRISNAMRRYAEQWDEMKRQNIGLLLYGPVGTGKTFFAGCIANEVLQRGKSVKMTSFDQIVNTMQGMYSGRQEYLDKLVSYSLLIIDDLGAERGSDYMLEQVYSVVNARYQVGLPLIVTTNIPIEEIKEPAELKYRRIYDRILERCHPVKVDGPSRRREAVKASFAERNELLGL